MNTTKEQAFKGAYGRLHNNPMDRDWNVWSAAWDAALATTGAQPAVEARTTERHIALREAHGYVVREAYFDARKHLEGDAGEKLFDEGFKRGFDAAEKCYLAAPAAPATTGAGAGLTREQAIALAGKHAGLGWNPHDWVVNAVIEASTLAAHRAQQSAQPSELTDARIMEISDSDACNPDTGSGRKLSLRMFGREILKAAREHS